MNVPVCVGTNFGDKTQAGDRKTPEGTFSISQIHDSSCWMHDFNDGAGLREGAYGPYFFEN
ncbi:MAG: L,D-transpeptidase [Paramuribaculum sp.]|nr:L,D-transpeptidase [Paramuribaculum sp.]